MNFTLCTLNFALCTFFSIQAVVDTILFGNLTLVPHHTVILDKTSCDLPHIKPIAPPITPPPPTAPPTSAPEICHTFYDIIQATAEPLVCMQMKDCTMGIQCTLEVLDTYYTLNITVLPSEKAFMFSVADSGQKKLGSAKSKNTTVSLPKPPGSSLIFNQTVSGDKKSIGFSVRAGRVCKATVLVEWMYNMYTVTSLLSLVDQTAPFPRPHPVFEYCTPIETVDMAWG